MGIVIGPIILAYFLIAALIATFVKPPKWKWGILAVYVAVPFGDHFLGWLYFRYHCAVTDGWHVYKTVENVKGFAKDNPYIEDYLRKGGYSYIEGFGKERKKKFKYSLDDKAEILSQEIEAFESDYIVYTSKHPIDRFYNQVTYQQLVIEDKSGNRLAELLEVQYLGGWIFRLTERFSLRCESANETYLSLVMSVLIPSENDMSSGVLE